MNTNATCPRLEIDEEEDEIDQCHNCQVLAEVERRREEAVEERRRAAEEERAGTRDIEEYHRQLGGAETGDPGSDDGIEFEEVV